MNIPSDDKAADDKAAQYLIEELKYIRSRIEGFSAEINRNELYYLGVVLLVYEFILDEKNNNYLSIGSFFPMIVSLYGIFRYWSLLKSVKKHDEYVRNHIESHFFTDSSGGFVQFFESYIQGDPMNHRNARYAFWVLAVGFSVFVFVRANFPALFVVQSIGG